MQEKRNGLVFAARALEESRGGWALFGWFLLWSTRNNRRPT